jgi:hypothetical protein
MLVLGFLQLGFSKDTVLRDFHPDAMMLFNATADLKKVCTQLRDQQKRLPRKV